MAGTFGTTLASENVTNQTTYYPTYWRSVRMQSTEWIVAQCIAIVVTSFAVYLVSALLYYELKKRGFLVRREMETSYSVTEHDTTFKSWSPSEIRNYRSTSPKKSNGQPSTKRRTKPTHEERYETWLRLLNLSAAGFAMLKCFTIQLDLIGGTYSGPICMGFAFATIICNGSSFISVYLLLWLRQWAVHSHPALQHLPVKKLRLISWILLGAMMATFASLCVMFFITIRVVNSIRGCVFADQGTISQGVRSGSGIAFTGIFQPALFCLMCYPLLKHTWNRRKAFGIGTGKDRRKIGKPLDDGEAKIYKIIRRLMISVILVMTSDIGGVVAAFLLEQYPVFYISIVYDVNITFGAYVITWSFNNWRERIVPFYQTSKKQISSDRGPVVESA